MADEVTLVAEPRKSGRHAVRELRLANKVPAVIYGRDVETQNVAIDGRSLHRALVRAGTSLITIQIGSNAPVQVLAREVQHDPVKHHALHVDFLAVAMNETLRLEVPITLEGTAPALARSGIVMVRQMDVVEVECLPRDIPQHLVANLSSLQTEADSIHVRDLAVPPGVKVITESDHVVISLTMSRAEEAEEAAASAAEPEVVSKGKAKEGEEAA
jgi:large subunit ribosomal protein L25